MALFVWARRALNRPFRRFSARAVCAVPSARWAIKRRAAAAAARPGGGGGGAGGEEGSGGGGQGPASPSDVA